MKIFIKQRKAEQEVWSTGTIIGDYEILEPANLAKLGLQKFSENISTHLFTVLTKSVIVISELEQMQFTVVRRFGEEEHYESYKIYPEIHTGSRTV